MNIMKDVVETLIVAIIWRISLRDWASWESILAFDSFGWPVAPLWIWPCRRQRVLHSRI